VFACLFDGKIFWKALIVLAAGRVCKQAGSPLPIVGFHKLVRTTLPAALTITVLVAATGVGCAAGVSGDDRGFARGAGGAPNIMLVILDAARAKNMSVYG
jgi:hypothetical protein